MKTSHCRAQAFSRTDVASVDMGDAGGPASGTVELGRSLYDAKLSIPALRPGVVSRSSLIEAARTSGRRVVAVTAPAGYGKSTLLAEWARAEDSSVAWVSLDGYDDDPAALLALLASAYGSIAPGSADRSDRRHGRAGDVCARSCRATPRCRASQEPTPVRAHARSLSHELRSPDCHDVLGVVLGGIGPRSQLVAASRSEQPHVPRLRASGDVLRSGPDAWPSMLKAPADLRRREPRSLKGLGHRGDATHRGLAGRPLPRRRDRPREP